MNNWFLMSNEVFRRSVILTLLVAAYAVVPVYAWYTGASNVISRDQWHHLTMVTAYFNHQFELSSLLLAHGEHAQLLYNAWFLFNGAVVGLDTQLEMFVGMAFLGGFLVLLNKEFASSMNKDAISSQSLGLFIPLFLVATSFHQKASFHYSLLSFVGFIGLFLMLLFATVLNKAMFENARSRWTLVLAVAVFLVLGLGIAGGGWVLLLGAALATFLCWTLTRKPPLRAAVLVAGALVLSAVVEILFTLSLSVEPKGTTNSLLYVVNHLDGAVQYVIVLFANNLVDVNYWEKQFSMGWVYSIGITVMGLYVLALYLFFKKRIWERSYIPFYLMMYQLLVGLALLMYRFPIFGVSNAASPRYATTLQIGLIGVIWIFILVLTYEKDLSKLSRRIGFASVFVVISCIYAQHAWIASSQLGAVRKYMDNAKLMVYSGDFGGKGTSLCPSPPLCRQGVHTLKENRLNIFKDAAP